MQKIAQSKTTSFRSEAKQLMDHLYGEVKDNPVFERLNDGREKWNAWVEEAYNADWTLPSDFEDSKALAFSLYRLVADSDRYGSDVAWSLFSTNALNDSIREFNGLFLDYLRQALQDVVAANPEIEDSEVKKRSGKTVFIIHGHDVGLKSEVQLLLNRAGVNNVVLHEVPDKGRTVIDKLIEEGDDALYAVALLTPDDVLEDGARRARQNVILEVGYFMGLLGKSRVRMVLKGEVEMPTDWSGILYEKYDAQGAWKVKLAKELQAVGVYVDLASVVSHL